MDNETVDKLMALGISGDDVAAARALVRTRHKEMGLSYQHILYAMLLGYSDDTRQLGAIVEMGSGAGLSTWYINKALAERGQGHLFSADPKFAARGYALEKMRIAEISGIRPTVVGVLADEERWTFLTGESPSAIELAAEAAAEKGYNKWTAYVHDSDPKLLDREIALVAPHLAKDSLFVVAGPAFQRKDLLETFAKNGLLMDKPFLGENFSIWCVEQVSRRGEVISPIPGENPEEADLLGLSEPVEAITPPVVHTTKDEVARIDRDGSPATLPHVMIDRDGKVVTAGELSPPPRTGDNIPEDDDDDDVDEGDFDDSESDAED